MDPGKLGQEAPSLDWGLQTTPGLRAAPLFSFPGRGKTFRGTTIGMAPLEGMCSADNSGGVSVVRGAGAPRRHPILLGFFTEDHRITEQSGLEGTSVGHPVQVPAEAGSPTAGCTAPRPGGSGISPEKETPQPPWTTWARADDQPSQVGPGMQPESER